MFMIKIIILAVICYVSYIILMKLFGKNVKLMRLIGVAVCDLSPEEREELAGYIDDVIQDAQENQKQTVKLSYKELYLEMFTERVEDEIETVCGMLSSEIKSVIFTENEIELEF